MDTRRARVQEEREQERTSVRFIACAKARIRKQECMSKIMCKDKQETSARVQEE